MPKAKDPKPELVVLYQEMADLTNPECRDSCRAPLSCCSPEYCNMTAMYAQQVWDITLSPTDHKRLPFMGPTGCIVAPHLRPWCTMHTCAINSLAFKPGDIEWTKRYYKLRAKIEKLEASLPPIDI